MSIPSTSLQSKKTASTSVFRVLLFALSFWFCAIALIVIYSRIAYPFDLEWMEGGSLVQVMRLLGGKALYVAPGLEYIPYIYPPLYFYLSALLAKITSLTGFLPLRLVSLSASLGIALLIFQIVRRQANSKYWAFIATGFFAATFQIGGAWFDISRVDMLFVFLLIAATAALERASWQSSLLAGFLFTCAFFTKQTAVFMVIGLLVFVLLFRQPKIALLAGLTLAFCSSAWIWIENTRSAGWFWYYIFTLPGLHRLPELGIAYIGQPILLFYPVCIAGIIGFARPLASPVAILKGKEGLWTVFALGMLATSIFASLNPGSFKNNYMPFYGALSILFGFNLPRILEKFTLSRQPYGVALLYTLCVAQFIVFFYNPISQIPTSADLQAGQALVERLRQVDGDVLIPNHNALAILAGKKTFVHLIALQEIRGNFGLQDTVVWNMLTAEIDTAFKMRKFEVIVLDRPGGIWAGIPTDYEEIPILYSDQNVFWPITGGRTRPSSFYTRPISQP